ncbi:MAG: SMP-30/gluconolactonase/LRE family protein [Steroidobacteraceae bacterium]
MKVFEQVCAAHCRLGESPVWCAEAAELLFVDVTGCAVLRFAPRSGALKRQPVDEEIGFIAPCRSAGFIAGFRSGIWLLDDCARKIRCLARNPADERTVRFNDGGIDPRGRLIIGTIDQTRREDRAGLYALEADGLIEITAGLLTSNGVAFAPDGRTLYHSDTPRFVIYRRAYCPDTARAGAAEVFARLDPQALDRARPDGAAVDCAGHYWCALYEGGRVHRYDPHGELIESHRVPTRIPTMPAFGDPDLKTLYLTTARDADGTGGGLYAMRVETAGMLRPAFDEELFLP